MIRVLVNAYACSPNMGSEPGMAWNWCVNLAKYCELHIITEGEFKDKIDSELPKIAQGKNMHFYYNPVSDDVRQMCWNQGDWRFYKHYREWQYKTYQMAKEIVKSKNIDILHQLNMIGFREPGYLWKIDDLPFIWGPVDAKEKFPVAYLEGASAKTIAFTHLKNFVTKLQLQYATRVRKAVSRAIFVVSASSNSRTSFKKYFNINSPLINETGCYIKEFPVMDKSVKSKLDVLWVGKLDFRKQLGLAIRSIAATNNTSINLHIIGGGNDVIYKDLANDLGIANQCKWYGSTSHENVQSIMMSSDLFFFTSVAEGTPHVVLEAISNNLPILCFDTCGQGDSVDDKVGIKVQLLNPDQSIIDFARELNDLEKNRNRLQKMAINCKQRQLELSWDKKVLDMIALYDKATKNYSVTAT